MGNAIYEHVQTPAYCAPARMLQSMEKYTLILRFSSECYVKNGRAPNTCTASKNRTFADYSMNATDYNLHLEDK